MSTNLSIDFIVSIAEDTLFDVFRDNEKGVSQEQWETIKKFAERLQEKLEAADADKAQSEK